MNQYEKMKKVRTSQVNIGKYLTDLHEDIYKLDLNLSRKNTNKIWCFDIKANNDNPEIKEFYNIINEITYKINTVPIIIKFTWLESIYESIKKINYKIQLYSNIGFPNKIFENCIYKTYCSLIYISEQIQLTIPYLNICDELIKIYEDIYKLHYILSPNTDDKITDHPEIQEYINTKNDMLSFINYNQSIKNIWIKTMYNKLDNYCDDQTENDLLHYGFYYIKKTKYSILHILNELQ